MSRLSKPARLFVCAGFTLVEVALVLVVVGLLIAMLTQPVQNMLENQKRAETAQILEETKEALLGYAAQNGRLPRPAISAADGNERPACTATDCHGWVPWATLGIRGLDGFGKRIRYLVYQSGVAGVGFANAPITYQTVSAGPPPSGGLSVQTVAGAANSDINGIAFILISSAKRNGGVDQLGTMYGDTCTPNPDEVQNQTGTNAQAVYAHVVQDDATLPGGCFDDMVIWVANSVLYSRLTAAGRNLN